MGNYKVQKWVLECTSRIIMLALVGETKTTTTTKEKSTSIVAHVAILSNADWFAEAGSTEQWFGD